MKIILSLSILGLIYIGSSLGLHDQLDISGNYSPSYPNSNIVESLSFKPDGTFEYTWIFLEGIISQTNIRGKYTTKGNEISLVLSESESKSNQANPSETIEQPIIKIRGIHEGVISNDTKPEQFSKVQTAFESGSLRLKPKYFIKLINGNLTLCLKDIRKDQFNPVLIKKLF